jgi:hypothetical protein
VEEDVLKTNLSRDLPSETLLTHHLKKILNKIEPSNIMSFQSSILKCSIALDAEFTLELSKSDLEKIEKSELPQPEFKEMPVEKSSETKENERILKINK